MPMQDVLTTGELLVRGVLEHRVTSLVYHGLRRTVEAHLVGIHEAGEAVLVGYQTGGESHSGDLPGWRTFIMAEVQSVELQDQHFSPQPGFDPTAHGLMELFARA